MSTDDDAPMPDGNGDKDCPLCKGRGVLPIEIDGWPGGGTQNCNCVFKRDLLANVKRVWKVLLSVESVEHSPLLALTKKNLWLTASSYTLKRHMRHVAFRMGTQWDARVVADATLITAWLSTAKNVRDGDVVRPTVEGHEYDGPPSDDFQTLVDLVVPFGLLIIRLGIKAAANKEMAPVLAEALNEREMLGKPTWVIDSPGHPLRSGHKCFSEEVMAILEDFSRVVLKDEDSNLPQSDTAQYAPKAITQTAAGVPQKAAPRPEVSNYAPKSSVLREMPLTAPTDHRRGLPAIASVPPPDPDEDEFSVDALMAAAVMPQPGPEEGEPDVAQLSGGPVVPEFDADEAIENYPDAADLKTNGTPKWLATALLTADDRNSARDKAKKDKKFAQRGAKK